MLLSTGQFIEISFSSGQFLEALLSTGQFLEVTISFLMASSLFHSSLLFLLLSISGFFAFTWHFLCNEMTFTYKKDNYSESTINNHN